MIEELHDNVKTRWEPNGKSTLKGFQSIGNLFKNDLVFIEDEQKRKRYKKIVIFFTTLFNNINQLFYWYGYT